MTCILLLMAFLLAGDPYVCAKRSDVAAQVGETDITIADLDQAAQSKTLKFRTEEFGARTAALERMVGDRLIAMEAESRRISVADLLRLEVVDTIQPATDQEVQAVLDYESSMSLLSETDARSLVKSRLRDTRIEKARSAFAARLRRKIPVSIYLDPPRLPLKLSPGPTKGPENAPVTVVEFSDFECPYCSRMQTTLSKIETRFHGRVRVVFKHFPLPMHANARRAAAIAVCAAEQGRFWEVHDRLYEGAKSLDEVMNGIGELGIDKTELERCMKSSTTMRKIEADRMEAASAGLTGTPSFMINGRPVIGAIPYEKFAEIVEDELDRKAHSSLCSSIR